MQVWKLYNTKTMDFHLFFCAKKAQELQVNISFESLSHLSLKLKNFAHHLPIRMLRLSHHIPCDHTMLITHSISY